MAEQGQLQVIGDQVLPQWEEAGYWRAVKD